jgi:hypothetical protein
VQKRHIVTIILIALLLPIVLLAGCKATDETGVDLGLDATQGGSNATATASGGSLEGTGNPKSPTEAQGDASAPGTGGSTPGGSASGGSASGGESGKVSDSKSKIIRILWWNDTMGVAPKNPEVVFDGKSVKPTSGRTATMRIGPCPVGKDLELVVYPDGRSGKKLAATFRVSAGMVADSEQDAIHIEVRDDRVRVLGNPVTNFEQSFARR